MWPMLKAGIKRYFLDLLIALDQLLNTILFGHPDETPSCRAYRKSQEGLLFWRALRWVIDHIFFWQEDHCRIAYESEQQRRHLPAEFGDQ